MQAEAVVPLHHRPSARGQRGNDDGVPRIAGEPQDGPAAPLGHPSNKWVFRVEHGITVLGHGLDDTAFDPHQVVQSGVDRSERLRFMAEVSHDAHPAPVEAQALGADALPRHLQDHRLQPRVQEQGAGTIRPGTVAWRHPSVTEEQSITAGPAHQCALGAQ